MSELLYARKLYALLQSATWSQPICNELGCLKPYLTDLADWWKTAQESCAIAQASDSLYFREKATRDDEVVNICHPISGQKHQATRPSANLPKQDWSILKTPEKAFWWFWRFCPELLADSSSGNTSLLFPAHSDLSDCPQHSYQATVSAIAGAMYEPESKDRAQPYLLLFSFSPVQEFIKASRKFLDFWAGSYLLHYLSAKLCFTIAQTYGPDAVIVPSLWNQEIFDALILTKYSDFEASFKDIGDGRTPVGRFDCCDHAERSHSLSTAGFPNVITALLPGKAAAENLGKLLDETLTQEWIKIGFNVHDDVREILSQYCCDALHPEGKSNKDREIPIPAWDTLWQEFSKTLPTGTKRDPYDADIKKWQPDQNDSQEKRLYSNWKWKKLWKYQLDYSWEPYWVAVPLGCPNSDGQALPLSIKKEKDRFDTSWIDAQNLISNCRQTLPAPAEVHLYDQLNVGTWWGSFQQRLGESLRTAKNTRVWQIPAAPGERSTLSGQFSVLHPGFDYGVSQGRIGQRDLREGAGIPEGSVRFFWFLMSKAYPGVFNGSERLNALELTKRLSWKVGGVAGSMGVKFPDEEESLAANEAQSLDIGRKFQLRSDYEKLIRFPNLSAIASARFVHDAFFKKIPQQYWTRLAGKIAEEFGDELGKEKRQRFAARTRCRPFQVPKTDQAVNASDKSGQHYNGVMFSSKWLAEDMGLETPDEKALLRKAVKDAHTELGFGDRSPSDWWVIVLADGDNMGKYVSGSRLKPYREYIDESALHSAARTALNHADDNEKSFLDTTKRMGPATHVGLNRALLDFSNRLVPYLTEKRFCGKLVYSGGDDVMAVLPIEDLPGYLLSLRAAWCGDKEDPWKDDDEQVTFRGEGGYWHPQFSSSNLEGSNLENKQHSLPQRPLFTMGEGATMSMGIVIAHKTVPLPTVLESLWTAEKDRAKKLSGKDGLCFRVIYGGGNQLEAVMSGELLADWWKSISNFGEYTDKLAPVFYRLAEELPRRALLTSGSADLFAEAAEVIMNRRDSDRASDQNLEAIKHWLTCWETWAVKILRAQFGASPTSKGKEPWEDIYLAILRGDSTEKTLPLGTHPDDLGQLLRFTAFWIDRRVERWGWIHEEVNT